MKPNDQRKTAKLAVRMDTALERVRRAWEALHRAEAAALEIEAKMGEDAWKQYARERGLDTDIHHVFGDIGT